MCLVHRRRTRLRARGRARAIERRARPANLFVRPERVRFAEAAGVAPAADANVATGRVRQTSFLGDVFATRSRSSRACAMTVDVHNASAGLARAAEQAGDR